MDQSMYNKIQRDLQSIAMQLAKTNEEISRLREEFKEHSKVGEWCPHTTQ